MVEIIPAPRPPITLEFTVEGDNANACLDAAVEQVHEALGGRIPVDLAGFKNLRMRATTTTRAVTPDVVGSSVYAALTWEMDVEYVDDRGTRGR